MYHQSPPAKGWMDLRWMEAGGSAFTLSLLHSYHLDENGLFQNRGGCGSGGNGRLGYLGLHLRENSAHGTKERNAQRNARVRKEARKNGKQFVFHPPANSTKITLLLVKKAVCPFCQFVSVLPQYHFVRGTSQSFPSLVLLYYCIRRHTKLCLTLPTFHPGARGLNMRVNVGPVAAFEGLQYRWVSKARGTLLLSYHKDEWAKKRANTLSFRKRINQIVDVFSFVATVVPCLLGLDFGDFKSLQSWLLKCNQFNRNVSSTLFS